MVLLTSSHPGAEEHALVELSDTDRAFPQDQYAPLIAADLEEQAPEVLEEISEALDDEAITVLRRLLHGEDAQDFVQANKLRSVRYDVRGPIAEEAARLSGPGIASRS